MKVLLKILKKNVRNSIVCFMSTILTTIILFVFLGVKEFRRTCIYCCLLV